MRGDALEVEVVRLHDAPASRRIAPARVAANDSVGGFGTSCGSAAVSFRAQSFAGTTFRRRCLGSALIIAVTSSARSPGTSQSKPSGVTRGSSASGTCTVTPSSSVPGSNRYERRKRWSAWRHWVGNAVSSISSASSGRSVSCVIVSRSGSSCWAVRHQESKERTEVISRGRRRS
ncbi:hypothetical protein ACH61_03202 [Rathayibacter tanaceti]|uniref:Uncharacterized protein n=1 Tax=Rathayibacter tanaceti TaxID=1671680 RepID=A0A166H098_9MICO|nr:hypothetical protein ACH61_03202 [Rathayibacter tanaceti]